MGQCIVICEQLKKGSMKGAGFNHDIDDNTVIKYSNAVFGFRRNDTQITSPAGLFFALNRIYAGA